MSRENKNVNMPLSPTKPASQGSKLSPQSSVRERSTSTPKLVSSRARSMSLKVPTSLIPPATPGKMTKASSDRVPKDVKVIPLTPAQEKKLAHLLNSPSNIKLSLNSDVLSVTKPENVSGNPARERSKSVGGLRLAFVNNDDDDDTSTLKNDDNATVKSGTLRGRDRIVLSKGYVPSSPRRSMTIYIEPDGVPPMTSSPPSRMEKQPSLSRRSSKIVSPATPTTRKRASISKEDSIKAEKERQRLEAERLEQMRLEEERLERERLERERIEREKREEMERQERLKMLQEEFLTRQYDEFLRLEEIRLEEERQRLEAIRLEEERIAREKEEEEERERQLIESERLQKENQKQAERLKYDEEMKMKLEAWRQASTRAKTDTRRGLPSTVPSSSLSP